MKILFLASSPASLQPLNLEAEARAITERARRAKYGHTIEIQSRWAVRSGDLQQTLLDVEPHVVHFSGHGIGQEGVVFHAEAEADTKRVSSNALANLFGVLRGNVRLVVLNACYSQEQAKAIVQEIDFVIGMSDAIHDEAAKVFAGALYRGLASGASVQSAFDMGLSELELAGFERDLDLPKLLVRPDADANQTVLVKEMHSPLWRRLRLRHLGFALGLLGVLLTIIAWLFPRGAALPSNDLPSKEVSRLALPDLYALRLQVLDPSGRPIDGSSVRTSSGNEPHLLPDGWWQLEIPRAKVPLDGQINIWAEHSQWKTARKVVRLGDDPNPALEMRLEVPRERVGGSVVDAEGRLIEGARVSVQNHDGSSSITDSDGRFELWISAAQHAKARLYVEHANYPPPQGGSCFVGRDGCSLILELDR